MISMILVNNWQCNRRLFDIDGLVHEKRDRIANALELCLSCTNSSTSYAWVCINIVTWCWILHVMCMARLLIARFISFFCVCVHFQHSSNICVQYISDFFTQLAMNITVKKSISNELDITIHVIASQLSCYCDVIGNRLWRHQQKQTPRQWDTGTMCKDRCFNRHLWICYIVYEI